MPYYKAVVDIENDIRHVLHTKCKGRALTVFKRPLSFARSTMDSDVFVKNIIFDAKDDLTVIRFTDLKGGTFYFSDFPLSVMAKLADTIQTHI